MAKIVATGHATLQAQTTAVGATPASNSQDSYEPGRPKPHAGGGGT